MPGGRMGAVGAKPAVAAGFTPSDIAGLSLWLDANDASTITTGAGSSVATWTDKSPNAYSLAPNVAPPPSTGTRTVNGLNALDFNGTQGLDAVNAPINNASDGSWTILAVCVTDTTASGARNAVDGDAVGNRVGQYIRLSAATSQTIGFNTSSGAGTDSGGSATAGATHLVMSVNSGTLLEVFLDGASAGGTAVTSQRYSATAPLAVGFNRTSGSQFWDGAICEVVAYDSDLAAGDISNVETYLADKWGVTL